MTFDDRDIETDRHPVIKSPSSARRLEVARIARLEELEIEVVRLRSRVAELEGR